jgi:predicted nucleic acid-binding protein
VTVYLDTSSLVKLYVTEPGCDVVQRLVDEASVVATSTLAYPEARAAFARRHREGALRPAEFRSVKHAFDAEWSTYATLEATIALFGEASELAERYRLRGYDSVHLASFAEIARRAGAGNVEFSSFDDALNRAAQSLRRRLARSRRSS